MYIITIDGPAASGKSTVAKIVAKKLNIAHINSGEAYRAIAYCMLNAGISPTDITSVKQALNENKIEMKYDNGCQLLYLNNEDITNYLHTNQINAVVSQYGVIPEVIFKASDMARIVAQNISVVMDGRNLGSFCFPDADYKFYIDCDLKVRAQRRMEEMLKKGANVTFDEMYRQVIDRDTLDKNRKVAPLIVPDKSILLDSSHFTAEELAQKLVDIIIDCEAHKER